MSTDIILRSLAFQNAGNLVMNHLISEGRAEYQMILDHPSIRINSEAKRLQILNQIAINLAGFNAVWLWVDEPPDELRADIESAMRTILSEFTKDKQLQKHVFNQGVKVTSEILATYRHAVETLALALMEDNHRSPDDIQSIIRSALDEEQKHATIATAGQAVVARTIAGHLEGLHAPMDRPKHRGVFVSVGFPQSDGLQDAIHIRNRLMPWLDPHSIPQAHAEAIAKWERDLMRGFITQAQFVGGLMMLPMRRAQLTSGMEGTCREQLRRYVQRQLTVLEAGHIAEDMAFGRRISIEGDSVEQLKLASEVSETLMEALCLVAEAQREASEILRAKWHAVMELAETLMNYKDIGENAADDLVDQLIHNSQFESAC